MQSQWTDYFIDFKVNFIMYTHLFRYITFINRFGFSWTLLGPTNGSPGIGPLIPRIHPIRRLLVLFALAK